MAAASFSSTQRLAFLSLFCLQKQMAAPQVAARMTRAICQLDPDDGGSERRSRYASHQQRLASIEEGAAIISSRALISTAL